MTQKNFLIYTKNAKGDWELYGIGSSMDSAAKLLSEKKVIKFKCL